MARVSDLSPNLGITIIVALGILPPLHDDAISPERQCSAAASLLPTALLFPSAMLRLPALLLLCVVSAMGTMAEESHLSAELMAKFQHWMTFHGKDYDSHDQRIERLRVWMDNDGKS